MCWQGRRMHRLQHVVMFLEVDRKAYNDCYATKASADILKVRWSTLLMADPFFWAYDPQRRKTRPCRLLLSHWTTASVKTSQPLSLWEFAWCARTVSTAFSKSTPGENGQRKDGQHVRGWPNLQNGNIQSNLWIFTLLSPSSEISMTRMLKAFNIRNQFFVHVLQAGGGKKQVSKCRFLFRWAVVQSIQDPQNYVSIDKWRETQ